MKKIVAIVAVMLLFVCAQAEETLYGALNGTKIFSVKYDEKQMKPDTTNYVSANTDDFKWLFSLKNDTNTIDCCLEYVPGYREFSSYLASDELFQRYISSLNMSNEKSENRYVKTYCVTAHNGEKSALIPFAVVKIYDLKNEWDSYYAETVSHGWTIWFEVYKTQGEDVDENDLQCLENILKTFEPITNG